MIISSKEDLGLLSGSFEINSLPCPLQIKLGQMLGDSRGSREEACLLSAALHLVRLQPRGPTWVADRGAFLQGLVALTHV